MVQPMLSLYRRHRPKSFDEVVGQDGVVRTLRNAIELGKVHHAYLFVGSRGTGKTSMAKLLACALNAQGGPNAAFSPDDPAAKAIMSGSSLDVVEMDAASNNSVDDIRELRENVALAPMGGGSRVYILDEAHMLTPAAWNAFLKTLEEPPSHVVFILATTEAHKVPPTIVDRCHRFDFQRPGLEQIAEVVSRVAGQEGIEIPDQAVGMIARKATGSFRDALGTLEQLVTYGGKEVALEDVLDALGVASAELILSATDALIAKEPKQAFEAVTRLADSGRDEVQFMRDLSAHLRHLYVMQVIGEEPETFAVAAGSGDRLAAQSQALAQADVVRAIDLLAAAIAAVKDGSDPRLQLEIALLKGTQPAADHSLKALLFRIDQLEARLAGAAPQAQAPAAPQDASPAGGSDQGGGAPPASAPPVEAPPQARAVGGGGGGPVATAAVAAEPEEEPEIAREPEPEPDPGIALPSLDLERVKEVWGSVAEAVREQNAMVAALLSDAVPSALDGDKLTIAFPADAAFSKKKAEANRDIVLGALRTFTGRAVGVAFELSGRREEAAPATLGEVELLERLKRDFAAEEIFEDDPETTED